MNLIVVLNMHCGTYQICKEGGVIILITSMYRHYPDGLGKRNDHEMKRILENEN